jgi:hypothetical protein
MFNKTFINKNECKQTDKLPPKRLHFVVWLASGYDSEVSQSVQWLAVMSFCFYYHPIMREHGDVS